MKSLGVIETRGWVAAPAPIVPPTAPSETEDKHPALKKGKKS